MRADGLDIDESQPSIARVYDYFLGGKDNYACDREFAQKLVGFAPEARTMARDNRAFLGRVVRFLARQGIRQFIDIGTGLPTQDNVHEAVQAIASDARVAYVDNDPIVLVHARALLADNLNTIVIEGDLRRPKEILEHPCLNGLIDFTKPMAILLVGVLYYLANEEKPWEIVAELRDAMPSGSYLALSHIISDDRPEAISQAQELYRQILKGKGDARRCRAQVQALFDGLEMVEPGLVYAHQWRSGWRAETADQRPRWILGGVGRKN